MLNNFPEPEKAVADASGVRTELQIASEDLKASEYGRKAANAENLPTIIAMADYGLSGTTWDNTARTGSIGGRLDLPIFSGGATHGRVVEAEARQKEAEERYRDMLVQVEEDVRLSLQTLTAEQEETRVADKAADLARKELTMARDRFGAGVGDNIQVLSAQTALDQALDDQVQCFRALRHRARQPGWPARWAASQEFQIIKKKEMTVCLTIKNFFLNGLRFIVALEVTAGDRPDFFFTCITRSSNPPMTLLSTPT